MARQPVIVALLALGCTDDPAWEGTFDVPHALAVLDPTVGGPFTEPVGYAASLQGGQIALLALKQGRYLTDSAEASFVRASPLPTGHQRVIGSLAVYAPDAGTVDVFAADRAYARLLRVPHVVGLRGGEPQRHAVVAAAPVFFDADASGDSPRITDVTVRLGWTTSETWTIAYDGSDWWASGSRSGRQPEPVVPGEPWAAARRAVEFTLTGRATAGDYFELTTDSGLVEYDPGGRPTAIAMAPDQSVLAVVVPDAGAAGALQWFDPAEGVFTGAVALPEGSKPSRITWADGALWVADLGISAVVEVRPGAEGDTVDVHPMPWPVFDVAPLFTTERLLYVVPADAGSLWVYDLDTGALRDLNPMLDGPSGIAFDAPVRGVEAIPAAFRWPEIDSDGVNLRGSAVAVSLLDGRVVFAEDGTGCLLRDPIGPRTDVVSQYSSPRDYTTNFSSTATGAFLEGNGDDDRSVQVNPCGGIARPETWTLTYDRTVTAWRAKGSRSGEQERLVYEDVRYTSDTGAISLLVRGGISPSVDGWQISFSVVPGVHAANGNNDEDAEIEVPFELPGDPVYFSYRVGPTGGGWDLVDERPLLLVAAENSDVVTRIEPPTGDTEIAWW